MTLNSNFMLRVYRAKHRYGTTSFAIGKGKSA